MRAAMPTDEQTFVQARSIVNACDRMSSHAIVAARKGERGNAAAEGAIHPETLRQMDRSCNELWRAAHAGGVAPTDGAAGCDLIRSPRISQVNGQGG